MGRGYTRQRLLRPPGVSLIRRARKALRQMRFAQIRIRILALRRRVRTSRKFQVVCYKCESIFMKILHKIAIYFGLFPFYRRQENLSAHVQEAALAYGILCAGLIVSFAILLLSMLAMKISLPFQFVMTLLKVPEYSVLFILALCVMAFAFGVISGLIQIFRNQPKFLISSLIRPKSALIRINFAVTSIFAIMAILYLSVFFINYQRHILWPENCKSSVSVYPERAYTRICF